ncbi:hypothetical protein GJU41_21895 [Bacillus idriensis]|uniref:DUF3888 domain-containing protein n=1 Tax=Metabacillus idriensis TaxID=324768 RepID=A0A6I2MGW5_9BACI|nr:hypothetical protein [Metabacillus idriensis]MRX56604.1 hypothetical protein [Metabacillus idriensis]
MKKLMIILLLIVGLFSSFSDVNANGNYTSLVPTKEELLEETLYSRYYPFLGKTYSDFILCPRVEIERINGDSRRHIIYASALNYDGHHGDVPYDKIYFFLIDTPEQGVKINKVTIQKSISEKESIKQCTR